MFVRIKKTGGYQYLQVVQNYREGRKTKQRVIGTLGRLEQLENTREIESLVKSLSNYTEKIKLLLTEHSDVHAQTIRIGPSLIFDRLWEELGIGHIIKVLLNNRKYGFNVERAIYMTVLHRLFMSGSDRCCEKWKKDYEIVGGIELELHQLYRAMAFLGEEIEDQKDKTVHSLRCTKDVIEEQMFEQRRDLFTGIDIVFFDTTSIYFEGDGGENIGQLGHSKDNRPDLKQMIVGAVLDQHGYPICCELWPGNTADIKTLLPVADRLKKRFGASGFCVVADRGMISDGTIKELEKKGAPYILGARLRRVNEIKQDVLSRGGRFKEVYPESRNSKDPSPLKVKEVTVNQHRYIVCLNEKQARKDRADREAIIASLEEKLKSSTKSLVSNKGYRKYLAVEKNSIRINRNKVEEEERYDGKWVLRTNMPISAEETALKYKELWMVEHVFRDVKSILETRPIYHKTDETIRGHVFCSFLALVLRKELDRRLDKAGYNFEWFDIKQDLKALQEVHISENNQSIAIRTESRGVCGKIFHAVGMAMPATIRVL